MAPHPSQEKILVVVNSLEDRDLIARQALRPIGYNVKTAELASTGIQLALKFNPDLIITNANLPDLSGKDLLVALQAQSIHTPVIMVSDQGREKDIIASFRLGAADYITKPLREAEVVAIVERSLQIVRARKERELLASQLAEANQALERRVSELTTLFALGKAVTSTTNQQELFKTITDGAVRITGSDRGYLLTRNEQKKYILAAYYNLPKSLSVYLNRTMDDGISSLVGLSGESLTMDGQALKRFNISKLGQSVLVVPIKAKKEVIGLLVTIRKENLAFADTEIALVEAIADHASISMVNARLFQALEERAQTLQEALDSAYQTAST